MKLIYKLKHRNFNFCSSFILKLYKKFLSTKLSIYYNKCIYNNLKIRNLKFNPNKLLYQTKIFYNRKEQVPLRILRYYIYFNINLLLNLKISNFYTNKLSIYNGKKAKPVNIFKVL
jgi:hypothetical protein